MASSMVAPSLSADAMAPINNGHRAGVGGVGRDGQAARRMMDALVAGERDAEVMADMALTRMPPKAAARPHTSTTRGFLVSEAWSG
jgi:hypothetical protein